MSHVWVLPHCVSPGVLDRAFGDRAFGDRAFGERYSPSSAATKVTQSEKIA
jgi:hypothetical protein